MGGRYPKLPHRNCLICEKDYKPQCPSQEYCSPICRVEGLKKRTILICPICKEEFEAKTYFVDRGLRKYCSKECQYKAFTLDRLEEKNPLWSGGVDAYRRIALRNNEIKCDVCGKKNCKLHVHHKDFDPKHKNNLLNNLQILCAKCHTKIHRDHKKGVIINGS